MFPIPWYVSLLEGVPENFLLIMVGFKLFNINVDLKKTAIISMILAVANYLIRENPLPYGIHTWLGWVLMVILTTLILRTKIWHSLVSVSVSFAILGVYNCLLMLFLKIGLSGNIENMANHPWLCIVAFLPLAVIMLSIYYLSVKYSWSIFDLDLTRDEHYVEEQ